ncbi:MAG: prolipoprotein diacylglyceryl transferase [Ruminococcaceae bacterium]|nr:prolipoprotein diacylglyceryl transferase [Oscillospiraceae bacterium]
MKNTIAFPGLGIGPFTLSEKFTFLGISIHYYGLIIAIGVVLAYLFAAKKGAKRNISNDTLLDVILWGIPSAIVCARLYYVAFSWEEYRHNLLDVFKIWEGGIAIYGAVIGASLSTLIYCHVKKISFSKVFDVGAFGLLIGQIVGRWGNFVNAEAYGSYTNTALFRMNLVDMGILVHPTFLYESIWNLGVFIFLNLYERYQKFDGEIFLLYLTGYGLGRFWIEGLRQDSLWIGPIRISQLLALICVLIGIICIILGRRKHKTLQ